MIVPGTWLKWYVTDATSRQPIYFRFIGRLTYESTSGKSFDVPEDITTYVIESQWHQRIYANDWFLHWLLPLDGGEEGRYVDTKKFVPRGVPEKPKKNPISVAPALAVAAEIPDLSFPRLLWRTAHQ